MRLTFFTGIIISFFLIGFSGCHKQKSYQPTVELKEVDGEPMLLGKMNYEDILYFFPEWKKADQESAAPDSLVRQFRNIDRPYRILIFLGTWCSDSREGVPPFMKIVRKAHNDNLSVEIIGVDRNLLDPQNMAPEYGVNRVPTFVILMDDKEIGRMVEFPIKTFAEDFLDILAENVE